MLYIGHILQISFIENGSNKFTKATPTSFTNAVDNNTLYKLYKKNFFSSAVYTTKWVGFLGVLKLIGLGFIAAGLATPAAPLSMAILAIPYIFTCPSLLMTISYSDPFNKRENIIRTGKQNLLFLLQAIMNTILDNNNKIKARDIRDKLKYWGLTKAQADFFFSEQPKINSIPLEELPDVQEMIKGVKKEERGLIITGVNDHKKLYENTIREGQSQGMKYFGPKDIIKFIEKSAENKEVLAPNEPFSIEVINEHYKTKGQDLKPQTVAVKPGQPAAPTGGKRKTRRKRRYN
jgi:hypothetical protein